jgi:hypothetical protein
MAKARPTHIALLILVTLSLTLATAQQSSQTAAPAPVPTQIPAARRVFISNAGYDATARDASSAVTSRIDPTTIFMRPMKKWGHYELVTTPADADLVFAVRFNARKATWDRNFDQGLTALMEELKALVAQSPNSDSGKQ